MVNFNVSVDASFPSYGFMASWHLELKQINLVQTQPCFKASSLATPFAQAKSIKEIAPCSHSRDVGRSPWAHKQT